MRLERFRTVNATSPRCPDIWAATSDPPGFACCAAGWVYCGVVREGVRVFSDFAIWYLFLAGTAGGAFLCATVNGGPREPRAGMCVACRFARDAGMLGAFGLLALAALMLFCDLGNPFDIWYLFESPLRSIVSMGAWLIALGLAFSLAVSAMIAAKVDVPYLFRFLEIAGAVAAIGVMGYTWRAAVVDGGRRVLEHLASGRAVRRVRRKLRLRLYLVFRFHPLGISAKVPGAERRCPPVARGGACRAGRVPCVAVVGGRRGAAVLRTAVFGTACRDLLGAGSCCAASSSQSSRT